MTFAVIALLLWLPPERRAEVYHTLQKRLDQSNSLDVTEGWNSPPQRFIKCRIVRPDRASKHGLGVNWWTVGKRTVNALDPDRDSRPATHADLRGMFLVGFESFYDAAAKVAVIGHAQPVSIYGRDYLAIDLKISATEYKLFLGAKTRLPVFFEDMRLKAQTWYSDIRLGPPMRQTSKRSRSGT